MTSLVTQEDYSLGTDVLPVGMRVLVDIQDDDYYANDAMRNFFNGKTLTIERHVGTLYEENLHYYVLVEDEDKFYFTQKMLKRTAQINQVLNKLPDF